MKRRLTISLALPITAGMLAVGAAMHSPAKSTFAAAGTPPPPPPTAPTPIGPPPPPPTKVPTATSIPTATSVPPTPTSAPPASTATPTPKPVKKTATPKPTTPPAATATSPPAPTQVPPATTAPQAPTATVAPIPTGTFHQGFGGTYRLPNGSIVHSPVNQSGAQAPTSLPKTGGASGNDPVSPLALLTILGGIVAAAFRIGSSLLKR